jgi:phage/plasmid primase-like uncharacterized protein
MSAIGVFPDAAQQPQRSVQSATARQNTQPRYTGTTQALDEFLKWCDVHGVDSPTLKPDMWVRTNSPHKKPSNKSLAVIQKQDCILAYDHVLGASYLFPARRTVDKGQWKSQLAEFEKRQAVEAQRKVKREKQAAIEVAGVWAEGVDCEPFGCMTTKRLTSTHGARWHEKRNCWLIPIYDIAGQLVNLQRVYNQSYANKFFWPGARVTACMMILGDLAPTTKRVLIGEGFSTCGTLRQETGHTVIGALNAGNLQPVCEVFSAMYPGIDVVVCGDDDRFADGNPGRTKAEAAALAIGARVAFPTLDASCTSCTDFNDAVACANCHEVGQ